MQWLDSPYPVALLIATTASATLTFVAWRRRDSPGATPLTVLATAVTIWQAGYAFETASTSEAAKILWAKVEYFGIVAVSTAWLAVTIQYSGRGEWLTRRNLFLLSVVPLVTLVLAWTNGSHELIWSDVTLRTSGSLVVGRFDHGPAFWVSGAYFYLLMIAGILILGDTLLRSPALYWKQSIALLVSAIGPWVSNWVFAIRLSPFSLIDPTPFGFVISFFALDWAVTRSRLLDIAPVAQKIAFENVNNGILVLDTSDRVADCNVAATQIFSRSKGALVGLPIAEAWAPGLDLISSEVRDPSEHTKVTIGSSEDRRIYDVAVSPLYGGRENLVGASCCSTTLPSASAPRRSDETSKSRHWPSPSWRP